MLLGLFAGIGPDGDGVCIFLCEEGDCVQFGNFCYKSATNGIGDYSGGNGFSCAVDNQRFFFFLFQSESLGF